MAFEDHKKRIAEANAKAAGALTEAELFSKELPTLTDTLRDAFKEYMKDLTEMGLDPQLSENEAITDLSGRDRLSVNSSSIALFTLRFKAPPSERGTALHKISVIAIAPWGSHHLELHVSEAPPGRRYERANMIRAGATADDVYSSVESAIDKLLNAFR